VKSLAGPLAGGALVAAALFGALVAAGRETPPPEDPWLDAWQADGFRAEFRNLSTEPKNHLMGSEFRTLFDDPALDGTIVRTYQVSSATVQVVELPRPGLLDSLPEGRHRDFKRKEKDRSVHLCRKGRRLLLVAPQVKWIPFVGSQKMPAEDVDRLFDAFLDVAEARP
jgi:hypothetical protein